MKKLFWFFTGIDRKILKDRARDDENFKRALKFDATVIFMEDMNYRIHGSIDNFATIFITGPQGTFKSSVSYAIAKMFDPGFNHKRIGFTYDEFEKNFEKTKKGDWTTMDETVFKFGTGSARVVANMQSIIETQRKEKKSIEVVSPELKYFPVHLFTYVIETVSSCMFATCKHRKGLHDPRNIGVDEVVPCQCWKENSFKVKEFYVLTLLKRNERYIGKMIVEIEWGTKDWYLYEKAKAEFNEKVKKGAFGGTNYEAMAKQVMKDKEYSVCKSKGSFKVLIHKHFPTLTIGEANMVAEQVLMKKKMEAEK